MYTGVAQSKRSPKETANVINRLFFWWAFKFLWNGAKRTLRLSDVYGPLKEDDSEKLGDYLEKYWNYELKKLKDLEYTVDKNGNKKMVDKQKMPSLYMAIIRAFWWKYFCSGIILCFQCIILRPLIPIFQGYVSSYFNVNPTNPITRTMAFVYAVILVVLVLATMFIFHHTTVTGRQIGMQVRVACSSLIYRKTLRLSKSALSQTAVGQIVNLLSNDVSRFDELPIYLNYVWIMPIQLVVIGYIAWLSVGIAFIPGVICMIVLTAPVHCISVGLSRRLRDAIASLTDKRVQLMSELIAGIQVVKMYAWEIPFAKIVSKVRAAELRSIMITSYIRGLYIAIILYTDRVALFVTLVTYTLLGNTISPAIAFVVMSYMNILQLSIALFFPQALIMCGETTVSIKRIEQFLLLEEVSTDEETNPLTHKNYSTRKRNEGIKNQANGLSSNSTNDEKYKLPVTIELERVSANWLHGQLPPTLCNISMEIPGGQLCALIGTVGSGKSSVLHLLMKELPLGAGNVRLYHASLEKELLKKRGYATNNPNLKISYASQAAWLFSGTVRENILFGEPFDKDKYIAVTKACALADDFKQFPHGDLSHVGENGSALSGGQKARVNLARAVYRDADVYLLDDPLSAVDTRVAEHLFKRCIEKYLRGKTRILVTHQVHFIKQADHIVVLDRGCVKMQGSYAKLSKTNEEFTKDYIQKGNEKSTVDEKQVEAFERSSGARASIKSVESTTMSISSEADYDNSHVTGEGLSDYGLSSTIYKEYFFQGASYCVLFLFAVLFIICQTAISGTDYWVSYWADLEGARANNASNKSVSAKDEHMYNNTFFADYFTLDSNGLLSTTSAIYVYLVCIVSSTVLTVVRATLFMTICMNASRNLHNLMFSNILQSSMKFFNHNPSGRILNRFSKDTGAVDEKLPKTMLDTFQVTLLMIAVFVVISIFNPWMIIPTVLLCVLLYFLSIRYGKTAQAIKHIEGISKSPIFSHVDATLNGLTTVRCSGPKIQALLRRQFDLLQNTHTGVYYMMFTTAASLSLVVDICSSLFVACVCFSYLSLDIDNVQGGIAALSISQALNVLGTLQYGLQQGTEMVSTMISVDRMFQYTKLPKESPLTSDDPPPATWPQKGRLILKNVSMRYEEDEPPVLKNLNVTIEPGWKVGVVGRTGAGKSSLISALFRLYPDGIDGEIKIDDRDTSTLGLHDLRSRLSIIPQQPVLFSESLRYNMDPFNSYDDAFLWDVLREVELNECVLDQMVQESGCNFSVGQRQLICLARAILRNNRILVLDEATANIDIHTDSLIQETIRTKFADCTVITIAHRLNTIIDSDRIIVVDNGSIVEFGCPYELLRDKPDGYFAKMVEKTGKLMAQTLWEQAKDACLRNNAQRSLELSHENSTTDDPPTVPA